MNAAIGSISSKLMVMHYENFAKFHGRLWEQIDNGYWIESSLVFSWRKGRILNRREYGFVTLQTNFIFESTKTWQKPLFSLPLLWNTTSFGSLSLNHEGVLNCGFALQLIVKMITLWMIRGLKDRSLQKFLQYYWKWILVSELIFYNHNWQFSWTD